MFPQSPALPAALLPKAFKFAIPPGSRLIREAIRAASIRFIMIKGWSLIMGELGCG